MRIILKPAGLAILLCAVVGLALLAFGRFSSRVGSTAAEKPEKLTGSRLISPEAEKWTLSTQKPAAAKMSMFLDKSLKGDPHALHLVVTAVDPVKYWSAQLIKRVPAPVEANHDMIVRFWGRSKTKTPAYIVFEEGASPHTTELNKVVRFTPEWKLYECPFVTTKDHTDIHANFCVNAGISPGEIDLASMEVNDRGVAK
ncbi:MAG: hypothetical protein V4671_29680 [Armatimonadota bacterium]